MKVILLIVFMMMFKVFSSESFFYPSEEFKQKANVQSSSLFEEASKDREAFWAKQAHCLEWFQPWDRILEWNPPDAKWFIGGKLNASYNCLDRHLDSGISKKIALYWEGERGDTRALTYEDLYYEVNKFSNVLKNLGVQKGDKVAIYLPMIPEAVVAVLSCARIGAVHTVVFGGFSSDALKDRLLDADVKVVITADGGFRKGKIVPLKETVDTALATPTSVKHVVVVRHLNHPVSMQEGRDGWYHTLMSDAKSLCPPEHMDSEDELFILYTSGTTGKPKGVVHTTGGYLLGATITMQWVFDVKPTDVYWCTADIGWITGHSYVVYGPLSNGMTQLIYEGAPDFPTQSRYWELIEKYGVTILYTAPTAIRTFMKWGEKWTRESDLSSLRLLGSVGEPINPEAWNWYHTHIGKKRCPVVDTWWQTETGCILIAPIPGITPLKPGSATKPLPGIDISILNDPKSSDSPGTLVITSPWPSMMRGIHNDKRRFQSYWQGTTFFTGDGVKRDEEDYLWLMGRLDDVINVSGHRLGTAEIESALIEHPSVAEAAVIGATHEIKGQAIVAFVILKEGHILTSSMEGDLKQQVVKKIGAVARPERIISICELPKTRSGKIMRRLLRDIAEGRILGDLSTLSEPAVIEELKKKYQED